MKQVQFGQIAAVIALILIFISAVGGLYIYSQGGISAQPSSQKESQQKTTQQTVASAKSQSNIKYKNFSPSSGIYSFNYPTNWEPDGSNDTISFVEIIDSVGSFKIHILSTGNLDRSVATYAAGKPSRDIKFGLNDFKHIPDITYGGGTLEMYYLPINPNRETTAGIIFLVPKAAQVSDEIVTEILSSFKIDPTKLGPAPKILTEEQQAAVVDSVRIRGNMNQFSSASELYLDANQYSYAGICNKANSIALEKGIPETLTAIEGLVKAGNVYCNSSAEAFVLSAPDSASSYYCIDSTGYRATQTGKAKTLTCR